MLACLLVLVKPGGQQLGWWLISVEYKSAHVVGQLQLVRQPRRRPSQQPGVTIRHRSDQYS